VRGARASGGALVTKDELEDFVVRFTDAFNREDLDGVMAFFADDAIYDEFDGQRRSGLTEIRRAFEPQFRRDFGRMRFVTEDLFVDPSSGKGLIRWLCTTERNGKVRGWRGLDILHVENGRLVEKQTYAKAERLKLEEVPPKS
jgi:ketosteroid isomerase-like protein